MNWPFCPSSYVMRMPAACVAFVFCGKGARSIFHFPFSLLFSSLSLRLCLRLFSISLFHFDSDPIVCECGLNVLRVPLRNLFHLCFMISSISTSSSLQSLLHDLLIASSSSRSLLTQLSSAFLTLQHSSTPSVNCSRLSTVCLVKPYFACGFIRRQGYDFSGVGALLIRLEHFHHIRPTPTEWSKGPEGENSPKTVTNRGLGHRARGPHRI